MIYLSQIMYNKNAVNFMILAFTFLDFVDYMM